MGNLSTLATTSNFEPCPEDLHQAVLVDIVDKGHKEKFFDNKSTGFKPTVQLVWQVEVEEENEEAESGYEAKRYLVFSREYVLSLDSKANFRRDLDSWQGKEAVEEKLKSGNFDDEELIGQNARIQVVHNQGGNGQIYANISAVLPFKPKRGESLLEVKDYVRRCKRDDWEEKKPEISAYDSYISPRTDPDAPFDGKSNSHRLAEQSKPTTDPRSSNLARDVHRENVKAKQKELVAAGAVDDDADDSDPFADE